VTLSPEQHLALDALFNRKNKSEGLQWYLRSTEKWYEKGSLKTLHTWKCRICNSVIHKDNTMMGSGSILCDHGLKHLNEHNLTIFI